MNYSKLLFALFLLIALVKSIPVPQEPVPAPAPEVPPAPVDTPVPAPAPEAPPAPVDAPAQEVPPAPVDAPAQEVPPAPENPPAPVEAPMIEQSNSIVSDFFGTITDGVVGKDMDITTLVTDGVINVLKNNLCTLLQNELSGVCGQLSEKIINAISGILKDTLRQSINTITGNGLSIACSVIPSDIFRNLSSVVVDTVTNELGKMENVDGEKINRIANNIISIIINTVENILCVGKKTDDIGNVIVNSIGDFASGIIDKVKGMNNNVKMSFKMEEKPEGITGNIAKDFIDIQETLKNFKGFPQPNEPAPFNGTL